MNRKTTTGECSTVLELRKDAAALKHLGDIEEFMKIPLERGGGHFSDWERDFVRSVRQQFDEKLVLSQAQRAAIADIWHAIDLRKRGTPEEKTENLFSKLSPERQAEQRARANKVKLPWE